jgi:hypothetical protein
MKKIYYIKQYPLLSVTIGWPKKQILTNTILGKNIPYQCHKLVQRKA